MPNAADDRARRIIVPQPPMGGKTWVLKEKGLFVLEVGPGTLRTIACTHAGAGSLEAIDGVPDADGFFPGERLVQPEQPAGMLERMEARRLVLAECPVVPTEDERLTLDRRLTELGHIPDQDYIADPFWSRNGRPLYSTASALMGSWMMDGGFLHGLTIRVEAGNEAVSAMATIVWAPFRSRGR